LRRLVLYQLCCRLRDAPAVDEATAVSLGVHPAEARPLAESVAALFPAEGPARRAAEEITDAFRRRRLRRAAELSRRLPAAQHDPLLDALREEIRHAAEAVAHRLSEAEHLRRAGNPRAAARLCLIAAREAIDDTRARDGLLAAAADLAGGGAGGSAAEEADRLAGPGPPAGVATADAGRRPRDGALAAAADLADGGATGPAAEAVDRSAGGGGPTGPNAADAVRGPRDGLRTGAVDLAHAADSDPADAAPSTRDGVLAAAADLADQAADSDSADAAPGSRDGVFAAVADVAERDAVRSAAEEADPSAGPGDPAGGGTPGGARRGAFAGPVVAVVDAGVVRLSWVPAAAAPSGLCYQVLRFPDGSPEQAVELAVVVDASAVDREPPAAVAQRYAVIPFHGDGRIAGTAGASAPVLLLPEPDRLRADAVPDGVRVTWRAHPAAVTARAFRLTGGPPGGRDAEVACGHESLTERPLPAGEHRYLVQCGYPGPGGEPRWSAGRQVVARAEEWPAPVAELHARRLPEDARRVELSWRPPPRGETRIVPWPGGRPPRPGSDVSSLPSARLRLDGPDALAANGTGPTDPAEPVHRVTFPLPPRAVTRLMAVSLLGERAVAGPTVVMETPGTAEGLRVRRLTATRAEVRFRWPEPAVLALLTWRIGQNGQGQGQRPAAGDERRLARSRHREGRVEIPVTRREHLITLTPVARPDATLTECGTAHARLPALTWPRAVIRTALGHTAILGRRVWRLLRR
jgi:hypothetical protein